MTHQIIFSEEVQKPNVQVGPPPQMFSCRYAFRACFRLQHWVCIIILLLFGNIILPGNAQTYAIDWFSIDGGGGTSSGGAFSLSGTIGQPDANPQLMTGGNFSLTGGFWSLLALQTPESPLLAILLTGTNTALVLWPSPSTGFTLQQNPQLSTTNWSAAPESVNDNGTNKFIIVNPPTGNRFYRLFKP
jgi:hypothetical protein